MGRFISNPIEVHRRPLIWLNVICLDAPLVAISWQWIFSHSFHIAVSMSVRAALFLTAWLIYLIDRFADSRPLQADRPLRQLFCSRHPVLWIGFIVTAAVLDAVIILSGLDRQLIVSGALLAGVAVVYLAVNYAFSQMWEIVPLKEVAVGFLFAVGTLLVFLPNFSTSTLAIAAFLFAVVCSLNCMSIAVWERELDMSQGKHSIATRWGSVQKWVRGSCILLAVASLMLGVLGCLHWPLAICLATSAVSLAALHSMSIRRDERTALADLVLLTPAAFLWIFS